MLVPVEARFLELLLVKLGYVSVFKRRLGRSCLFGVFLHQLILSV